VQGVKAHPQTFYLVKIWAKSLKIRANSAEILAKSVKTFAKLLYVLSFYKNGTQNQSADFFYWRSCFVYFFSGKLGKSWAKMVLEVP